MRRVWTLVSVLGPLALLTGTAVAHPERQALFPDPNKGAVPSHGGHNKKPLIVCKSNSKRLIKKIFKGKKRRGKRLQRSGSTSAAASTTSRRRSTTPRPTTGS